ncbi:L-fucose dehydrogenase-like [Babylonia areolata]|uniref:L-fucose dehydrogenase-like n=1 Tax=Babylonia areolata TaxID=304850 RepID=UPI003FD28901
MEKFINKVVLITGSSAGIGAGIAKFLAAQGASLSLTGRDGARLDSVKQDCVKAGIKPEQVLTTAGDLSDEGFRSQLVSNTVDRFGKLDVLVNNAGIAKSGLLSEPGMDTLQHVLSLNFLVHVALSKLAVPHLLQSKGNIVNISSNLGFTPSVGLGPICISKAALDMHTKVMAMELAPKGVRVNSVNPGAVRSDIGRSLNMDAAQYEQLLQAQAQAHPLGRVGEPEDIARAVAFLASEGNSFVTGLHLVVDGGGQFCTTYNL